MLDPGYVEVLVVAQHTGHGDRLDRGEVIPVVVVDDVCPAASEVSANR